MYFCAIFLSSILFQATSANDLMILPNDDWFVDMLFEKYATNNVSLSLTNLENIMSLLGILDEHDHHGRKNGNVFSNQNFSLVFLLKKTLYFIFINIDCRF